MGMRILEVNDDSLLGCTKEEAAALMRRTGSDVHLLVCDGFDPSLRPDLAQQQKPPKTSELRQTESEFNGGAGAALSASTQGQQTAILTSLPVLPPKKALESNGGLANSFGVEFGKELKRNSPVYRFEDCVSLTYNFRSQNGEVTTFAALSHDAQISTPLLAKKPSRTVGFLLTLNWG